MTQRDKDEFRAFLRTAEVAQVRGIFVKESNAGRPSYASLAKD